MRVGLLVCLLAGCATPPRAPWHALPVPPIAADVDLEHGTRVRRPGDPRIISSAEATVVRHEARTVLQASQRIVLASPPVSPSCGGPGFPGWRTTEPRLDPSVRLFCEALTASATGTSIP